jgi:hypothetical protein
MSRDARCFSAALLVACLLSMGASYRTQNFIVTADTPQLAQEIGDAAERFRRDLAIEWLGRELPPWTDICPITAQISPNLGAGGATSFYFSQGRAHGWRMTLQGSRERVLDSVLPHEVTHTIFATHFGRPLPRWADEGACTTVEHVSERAKQHQLLISFLTTGRGIAFNHMFAMREYPPDILPLYSQGYSLAKFLIAQGGKRKFMQYVGDGMASNNWTAATHQHYGYDSLGDLQQKWLAWVKQGSPIEPGTMIAANQSAPAAGTPIQAVNAPSGTPAQLASAVQDGTESRSSTLFASSADSWYARQRDLVQQGTAAAVEPLTSSSAPSPELTDQPLADEQPSVPTAVTRVQEIGRPTQTVLPPLQPVQPVLPPLQPVPTDLSAPAARTAGPASNDWHAPVRRY